METERKYLKPDLERTRLRLRGLGAVSRGPHFESNVIFDSPDSRLCGAGELLRLRLREWPDKSQSVLTFKYPCEAGLRLKSVKAREELETLVENGPAMREILERLGFRPVARYEKIRDSWRLEFGGEIFSVELDSAPFGDVVEVEGAPSGINAVAEALGLDKCETSLKTYHELNQEWRVNSGGEQTRDLLFAPAARSRLRAALGLGD